jgi:hypothetical protein
VAFGLSSTAASAAATATRPGRTDGKGPCCSNAALVRLAAACSRLIEDQGEKTLIRMIVPRGRAGRA